MSKIKEVEEIEIRYITDNLEAEIIELLFKKFEHLDSNKKLIITFYTIPLLIYDLLEKIDKNEIKKFKKNLYTNLKVIFTELGI